ncbi:MAG TPA: peptidylprolyl isomerase [Kofleriaceae bacterium]|nr:peptidylprolyl isomerase [Kofleriaceae bacterium]
MRSIGLLALFLLACGSDPQADPDAAPGADADGTRPVVVLSTSLGDLVLQLEPDEMPITTANFLSYVDDGWYDGTLVHRVVDDWVIQGGGYTTGLAAKTPRAPIVLETSARVSHVHGAISMARTSDPNSATTQWFIVDWPDSGTPPQPGQLDGEYAAFGVLIEGFDVLAAITQVSTGTVDTLQDVPDTEIVVSSAARR